MLRILFLFNAVPAKERQGLYSDCLTRDAVHQIYRALLEGGNEIYPVNVHSRRQLEKCLSRLPRPHLAFTLAEGYLDEPASLYDGSGAAAVRFFLQEHDIPASHSPAAAMEICRHKHLTYRALQQAGLPVPPHRLLVPPWASLPQQLDGIIDAIGFPMFVKPNGGGNSIGIGPGSVVSSLVELEHRLNWLRETLGELPVLVEKYLPGQEYTVGIIGRAPGYVLPVIVFLDREIRTTVVKSSPGATAFIFPEDRLYHSLARLALAVLAVIGGKDCLRVDLRADSEGELYIIDVNGTPSLSYRASLTTMAMAAGLNYSQFINLILYQSLLEYGLVPGDKMQDLVTPALTLLCPYNRSSTSSLVSTA